MSLPTPNTRKEQYLNAIATGNAGGLPTPITREEEYLDAIAKSGGGGSGEGDMKKSVYDSDLDVANAGGIGAFVSNAISGKVDKVAGKGLSTNDYDNTEKEKVADNTTAIGAITEVLGAKNQFALAYNLGTTGLSTANDKLTNTLTDSDTAFLLQFRALKSGADDYLIGKYITSTGRYELNVTIPSGYTSLFFKHNGATQDLAIEIPIVKAGDWVLSFNVVGYNPSVVGGLEITEIMLRPAGTDATYVPYAMTNRELTDRVEAMSEYEPNDITSRLSNLSTAIAEGNLAKYGYKIGDYFDGANYRYWLGHLNYNYGGYDYYAVLGTLNIGLVVDTKSNSQWNTSNDTTGGYESSALHTYLKGTVLDNIKADLKSLFGGSTGLEHLVAETKLFASNGTWEWSSSAEYISALTEVNMYGCPMWSVDRFQQGEADQQLEIFRKYKYNRVFGNNNIWLRSIYSASEACYADRTGNAGVRGASSSFEAAGLIIFH